MLVGHYPVKSHFIRPGVLVVVIVVQHVGLEGIKVAVWEMHPAGLVMFQIFVRHVAVGLLGKPKNLGHGVLLADSPRAGKPGLDRAVRP